MAFLGKLIKTAIDFRHNLRTNGASPVELQENQLKQLLAKAEKTSFGLYYGFSHILKNEDPVSAFRQQVPIHEYEVIHEKWWTRQQRFPDITWPGRPDFFASSSATTGSESKRIPVTEDMLASMRGVSLRLVENLSNFNLPPELFEKEVLMLGSTARLEKNENGAFREGEISGINASNIPSWFEGFYRPGAEIANIPDWDKRIKAIVNEAPSWDIGAMAGIPSWIQLMLEAIIEHHQLKNIHELWPGLQVYVSGGVAFDPYRQTLEALFEHPLTYLDTYLASEGFFGYTARPGTMDMRLALEHGTFFEFIPFDERGFKPSGEIKDDPEVLTIAEVEENQEYALIITTCAGAWRYVLGDVIRFTDREKDEITITGRTKYFLNAADSQLSGNKISKAVKKLDEEIQAGINEYAVAALTDDNGAYFHQWVFGCDHPPEEDHPVAQQIDDILKASENSYEVARKNKLKGVKARCVHKEQFYDWLEKNKKKGGQVKTPKVMEPDMMKDLLEFIK